MTSTPSGREAAAFTVVVLGEPSAGKTSLVNRLVCARPFRDDEPPTLGFEETCTDLTLTSGATVALKIWDASGKEQFRAIVLRQFPSIHAAVVVFDVTSRISFQHVSWWLTDLRERAPLGTRLALVANKEAAKRVVSIDEATQLSDSVGATYFEVCAKSDSSGEATASVFRSLAAQLLLASSGDADTPKPSASNSPTLHRMQMRGSWFADERVDNAVITCSSCGTFSAPRRDMPAHLAECAAQALSSIFSGSFTMSSSGDVSSTPKAAVKPPSSSSSSTSSLVSATAGPPILPSLLAVANNSWHQQANSSTASSPAPPASPLSRTPTCSTANATPRGSPAQAASPSPRSSPHALLNALNPRAADVVRISAGGAAPVAVSLDVLRRCPDSALARLFDGTREPQRDASGAVFLDMDAEVFRLVLNFLRTGLVPAPAGLPAHVAMLLAHYARELSLTELYTALDEAEASHVRGNVKEH